MNITYEIATHKYCSKFEECIRDLAIAISRERFPFSVHRHTVANSILFPRETATRSPFFTPSFCNPRANVFESRSRASYVSVVR